MLRIYYILMTNTFLEKFLFFQAYRQCFCGDSIRYNKVADSECGTPCSGNSGNSEENCGGVWRMSVYNTGIFLSVKLSQLEAESDSLVVN